MALSKIVENSITDGVVSSAKLKDFSAAVDLNGVELILDADQDTSITADTDDRIDFKIANVEHFSFSNSSGDTVVKPMVDAKDIIFQQYDGNKLFEINDGNFVSVGGNAAAGGEIRIYEDTDLGTNYTGFKAGNLTGSVAYQLPLADGSSGQALTTDSNGVLSWTTISTALDDLTTGDAAVTLATSAGNITIDAQGNDTDIIFKGTDGGADRTFMTIDGSAGGDLFLTGGLIDLKNDGSAVSQIKFYCESSNAHAQTLIGAPHSESATNTLTLPSTGGNSYLLTAASTATLTNKTLTSPKINEDVAVTATATEINLIDGGATVGTTAIADGDGLIINDAGTMRVSTVQTLAAYLDDEITAMPNLTSVGTLTALTVDDVAVDGKVITMTGSSGDTFVTTVAANGATSLVTTDAAAAAANFSITADGTVDIDSAGVLTLDSGAAINIEPASGSAILLDGTISIDAGVVTGATSITSTAFVGGLTGNVTGNASGTALTVTQAAQTAITSVGTLTALTTSGVLDLTGTTDASDASGDTGILRVEGGASIAKKLYIGTDLDVDGTANLDVVDIDGAVDMASTLQVDGAITSSAGATITTADNLDTLTLTSTDADANAGANLRLYRNSASPADNDDMGRISFEGRNDNTQDYVAARIWAESADVSDGTEDAALLFDVMKAGTVVNQLNINPAETIFNETGSDQNFRFESSGKTHALFIDGANGRTGINHSTPEARLEIDGGGETGLMVRSTVSGETPAVFQSASTGAVSIADFRNNGGTSQLNILSNGRGLSQFTAKAWVNFNGDGTVAIRDSHNVSSITDNGTGNYNTEFTNNTDNTNYAVVSNTRENDSDNNLGVSGPVAYNVTSAQVLSCNAANANPQDSLFFNVIVFGD